MDKWKELRLLIEATISHNVQYSYDKNVEHYSFKSVLNWMDDLDRRERISEISSKVIETHHETLKKLDDGFLFTDVPTFDRSSWQKIKKKER